MKLILFIIALFFVSCSDRVNLADSNNLHNISGDYKTYFDLNHQTSTCKTLFPFDRKIITIVDNNDKTATVSSRPFNGTCTGKIDRIANTLTADCVVRDHKTKLIKYRLEFKIKFINSDPMEFNGNLTVKEDCVYGYDVKGKKQL